MKADFADDKSWIDGDINGYGIGPDSSNYYTIPYSDSSANEGSFSVQLKNTSDDDALWIESTGTIKGMTQTIRAYAKIVNVSPWNNAIFAGKGASGTLINGNVDVRGSVHILGTDLGAGDLAVSMGGTAELVGNNYDGMPADLEAKVPILRNHNY